MKAWIQDLIKTSQLSNPRLSLTVKSASKVHSALQHMLRAHNQTAAGLTDHAQSHSSTKQFIRKHFEVKRLTKIAAMLMLCAHASGLQKIGLHRTVLPLLWHCLLVKTGSQLCSAVSDIMMCNAMQSDHCSEMLLRT